MSVDVAVAFRIVKELPFTGHHDQGIVLVPERVLSERMPHVLPVEIDQAALLFRRQPAVCGGIAGHANTRSAPGTARLAHTGEAR
ncbi:MAG: hypothetical protein AMXMBFR13_15670 [Phycisphaerae bacterium]